MYQEWQKRDNQQRKLKHKGNGAKDSIQRWDQWRNDSARIPHHIMMVRKSIARLGTLATRRELYRAIAGCSKSIEIIRGAPLNGEQDAGWPMQNP